MNCPGIVNIFTKEVKTFEDVKEITIGRSVTSSIDIPSPFISRNQCIMKLTENKDWSITDLSSHHTTLLNDAPVLGSNTILKNGDKISFLRYNDAEYLFYSSALDIPNPAKRRRIDNQIDSIADILTPTPMSCEVETADNVLNPSQNLEIEELNNELEKLRDKYDLALEEINNQRRLNETVTQKLNIVLKESNETVSNLQKENEILNGRLIEGEFNKEKMVQEIQDLNELLKESELEQIRLADEYKCQGNCAEKNVVQEDYQPEKLPSKEDDDSIEPVSAAEADALQKLVEIVEIKWNEQEMEHMREELKKRDEQITDMTLETEKYRSDIVDTLDREMLCSICNDILYEATTLNCKHTFCKACVVEWKKKKKECPVCRSKIKTETQPLVIDSFIDKLAETIGGDLKTRRAEVRNERTSKPRSPLASSSKRGRNRGNRRARGNFNTISSAMSILQPLVIELRDHFAPDLVPGPIIDLTGSPATPLRRGRRMGGALGDL